MMIFQRILSIFPFCVSRLYHYLMRGFDWWRPVRISRWLHHDKNYGEILIILSFNLLSLHSRLSFSFHAVYIRRL